jgi:hypothetical protein
MMRGGRAAGTRTALALLVLASAGRWAAAQDSTRMSVGRCNGQVIRAVRVVTKRPPFEGQSAYWRRIARRLGLHHATTDSAVVRRFLTLQSGVVCSEFRLRESERLLRAQPYLAAAAVRAVRGAPGEVLVDAETVDEIPAIAAVSFSGTRLTSVEVGNENVFGKAWLLAARASRRPLEGRAFGLRASDFQFLGRPYVLNAEAEIGDRTRSWQLAAGHAYLTDLQQIAWEAGISRADRHFVVVKRGRNIPDLGVGYRTLGADIGAVVRLGGIRHPVLLGGAAVANRLDPAGVVAITDSGVRSDTALAGRYPSVHHARLVGTAAWRNLTYITVRGFDALTAPQDVATGTQLRGQLGRGIRVRQSASDLFALGDLYAGTGTDVAFGALHLLAEGRREIGSVSWDGIVASGRITGYWKPTSAGLLRGWLDGAGTWRIQTPAQLRLATDEARVAAYSASLIGARRAGGGVEARRALTWVSRRADVGVSLFVEAARLWAGDAPYGVSTPVLPSAGIGILAAVPRGSKRLGRLDLTFPLRRGIANSGVAVRFSFLDRTSIVRKESDDVARTRQQLVGPDIFSP